MPCGGMHSGLADLWAIGGNQSIKDKQSSEKINNLTSCPECGWRSTGDFSWCPQCAARLRPWQCAFCQSTIPPQAQECIHCGAPLP